MIDICLLGTGGVMPLPDRWLAALLIRYNGKMILFDCGEATQIPLRMAGWGFKGIDAICFTHYHADHISGLPGLLLTIGNSGREETLTLIGPPGLENMVDGLSVVSPELPYDIKLIELSAREQSRIIINGLELSSVPVEHTLPCLSYCIELKRQGKFDAKRAEELNIPIKYWKDLQRRETVLLENSVIYPDMVLGQQRKGIKICYCTDSRPTDELPGFIDQCDLFIAEGMYGDEQDSEKALQKKHMTFSEAALLAKRGNAGELWLTHYSPSLTDPDKFIHNAKAIFEPSFAGRELMTKSIGFSNEGL